MTDTTKPEELRLGYSEKILALADKYADARMRGREHYATANARNNLRVYVEKVESHNQTLQAKIDALMLEYCPQDMSVEQIVNWSNHQRKEKA
jgi:hypothetical protein